MVQGGGWVGGVSGDTRHASGFGSLGHVTVASYSDLYSTCIAELGDVL
jgi:hypothetical protein